MKENLFFSEKKGHSQAAEVQYMTTVHHWWDAQLLVPSVSHEASPYFLVKWGQDPHGLLLQTIIGGR
jgi:hypothetical protein